MQAILMVMDMLVKELPIYYYLNQKMAEKSIKKNFIFNIVYQVLLLVSPLIVTPYVSRVLGADGIGEYSYANSIVSYFMLIAVLGTSTFGQRSIGYAQKDVQERSRAFWEIFILRTITSMVTLACYLAYVFIFVNDDSFVTYLILALNLVNVMFDITWFFQGMEEFGKTVTTSLIVRIMYVVAIFLLVKTVADLWIYILIVSAQVVLANLCLWVFLPKYIQKTNGIKPFKNMKTVFQMFIPTVATQIYVVLDKSMIGWFTDSYTENGYYEQAEKVVRMTLSLITALGTVMIPRISRCFKEGNTEAVKYFIYKSYRFIWMMAIPIMFGLISIASVFVPVFFGDGYEKCELLIPIFSCLTVFIGLSNVTGIQYFIPTGRQNILTMTVVVGAVVNLCLNLVLIPFFASVGAAIASIIAEGSITLAGFIYVKKTGQYEIRSVFVNSWKYWLAGIVMFAVVFGVKYFFPISVWTLLTLVAIGAVVYFIMLVILRDGLLYEILSKLFSKLKRNKSYGGETKEEEANENPAFQSLPVAVKGESVEEMGADTEANNAAVDTLINTDPVDDEVGNDVDAGVDIAEVSDNIDDT